jgi:hypothetical protein
MWNDVKLSVAIKSEEANLAQLNEQKEQFAAKAQWAVVNGLKVEISKIQFRLQAYRAVLESDE